MSDKAVVLPTKVLVPSSTCDKVFLAAATASKRQSVTTRTAPN